MLRIESMLGNGQRLDGGSMFGNAPRAVWSRWCPPDEQGRIELACRAMLVDEGDRTVLFETGIGAFFEPRLRDRFGVFDDRHVLLDSLRARGLDHADIDVVVLSHLHFDHAGGLLSAWSEGADPELLFPNATFVVGARAFERASKPHPRDRASFIPGLTDLLQESGRLDLVEGERSHVLGERYRFVTSDGHTPGMLHGLIQGRHGQVFFCADLVPGVPWVHVPITMGYDRFPEALIDEKLRLFGTLEEAGAWLFFTHDAVTAVARIRQDERGRYRAFDERSDGDLSLDLDRDGPAIQIPKATEES
jgi:glyoxylase-like metal-dependent hydrolase (beta-lactamase superfamily II)